MKYLLYSLAIFSSSALALGIDLVGGMNTTTPSAAITGSVSGLSVSSTDSGSGSQYGVLLEVGGMIGIQTGALFIQREETIAVTKSPNTVTIKNSWKALQVPMLIRLHPVPFLAFGAGVALNMGQGDLTYDRKDPGNISGGTKASSQSFDDFGQMKNDWVGVVTAEIDVPLAPLAHLILRADYQQGLTNVDNSGTLDEKLNTITYMGGLGFSF